MRWRTWRTERGALLFVDAIQGLGVFPLDVGATPIDFLAADGHKWMLGPEGAGLFYIRGEHLDLLEPRGVGWNSVQHAGDFANDALDLKPRRVAVRRRLVQHAGTARTGGEPRVAAGDRR